MSMNSAAYDALAKAPLFSDLAPEELKQLAGLFKERRLAKGKVVIREGQSGDAFFVIKSGRVMVTLGGEELGTLSTGDCFGEIALFDQGTRTATVTASDDLVCYGLPFADFRAFVESNGAIGWKLLHRMTRLFRDARSH